MASLQMYGWARSVCRSTRVVYLSNIACQAIQRYLDGCVRQPTDPLWLRPTGRPITDKWLRKHVAAIGRAAGVPEVSPHRLRHTLATRLLNAGMDVTCIQRILGHQHISTTMIYARVLDTTVEAEYRNAMSVIESQCSPLPDTPILVADWPTQAAPVQDDQFFKVLPLDNSV